MKKIISLLFCVCLLFSLFCACEGNNSSSSSSSSSQQTANLVLSQSKKELFIGDEYGLKIYSQEHRNQTIVWVSSNPSVASVENGVIVALKEGTATITATAEDGSSSTCEVVVGTNGKLPVLEFEFNYEANITLSIHEKLNFEGWVEFNNRVFTDAVITYISSNEQVGKFENDVFVPLAVGETTVTVSAAWREVQSEFLTKTFTIRVI